MAECTRSLLVLLLLLTGSSKGVCGWNMTRPEMMRMDSNRNMFLLIFIPVHQKGPSPFSCGPANESAVLSQLTTLAYALNATNEESLLRTGITLGAYVIDYCAQPVRAVMSLYQLLSGDASWSEAPIDPAGVVGVISLENHVTEGIRELLDPLEIPLVSGIMKPEWISSSLETLRASNEIRLAVATRDWLQAVAAFLLNGKTDFISLLVAGDYGERSRESLLSLLDSRVCVVNTFHVMHESEMKSLARTIAAVSEGHVLVILADDDQLILRFLKIYSTTAPSSLQLFVIDDRLLSSRTLESVHVSFLLVGSAPALPSEDFEDFAKGLTVHSHGAINDQWFRELWQHHFQCAITPTPSWPLCTGRESLGNLTRTPAMDYTLLAVKTLSLGFQNFLTRNCPQRDRINVIDDCGPKARTLLLQESTRALNGDPHKGQQPLLPRNQQRLIRFQLHYREADLDRTAPTVREVASWENGSIHLVEGVEHAMRRAGVVDFPCVDACARACPDKAAKTSPAEVDPAINFRTTWGLVTSSLSALGMLLVLAFFAYLLVVIPSSRGTTVLNYVILFGLFGVFGSNFFFVATATEITCTARRFLMGFAYAIVFSAKLTKVVSIWRRSKREQGSVTSSVAGQQQLQHGEAKPSFVVVVAAGMALFQGCIAAAWLILSPPHVLTVGSSLVLCSPGTRFEEALVISLLYVMLLMALTLTFAVLTWKHESNQRESRWILLSTSLTCCAWLLWTIVATQADYSSRNPAIVVGNLLSGFAVVLALFVPKLYLYSKLLNQAKKLDIRAFYPQRRSFRGQAGGVSSLYDPLHPSSTLNSNYSSVSGTFSTTASKKRRPAGGSTGTGSLPKRPAKDVKTPQPSYPRPFYDGRSQFLVEQQQPHLNQPYPLVTTPQGINPINCVLPHSRTVQNPGVEYF